MLTKKMGQMINKRHNFYSYIFSEKTTYLQSLNKYGQNITLEANFHHRPPQGTSKDGGICTAVHGLLN